MPAAAVHECVAKVLNEKLKKDEYLFILGNIAPDCWRNAKLFGNRKLSHFATPRNSNEDYNYFIDTYKNHLDNPFVLGYLTHLITDTYWHDNVTPKFEMTINGKLVLIKSDGSYYQDTDNIETFEHEDKLKLVSLLSIKFNLQRLKHINCKTFKSPIKELDITGLNATIDYVNTVNFKPCNDPPEEYDIDKITEEIYKTSDFILKILQNIDKEKVHTKIKNIL